MQVIFTDHTGDRVRGRLVGTAQIGMVPVLLVNANGRSYIVEAATHKEFLKDRREVRV